MNIQITPLYRVKLALAFHNRDLQLMPCMGWSASWLRFNSAISKHAWPYEFLRVANVGENHGN